MRLLVLDTETTGFKAGHDALLEVGAALFDSELKETLWAYATLLPILVENQAVHINNITQDMMKATIEVYEQRPVFADVDGAMAPILQLCDSGAVDIIAAHKKDFDASFINAMAENPPLLRGRDRTPLSWICTCDGIRYPQQKTTSAIRYLAVDHGIPVGSQHRALADVMLVCDLLALVPDLDEQIVQALKPTAVFQALVSYDNRELAKKAGFRWNKEARRWEKKLPADTAIEPTQKRPFSVRVVG